MVKYNKWLYLIGGFLFFIADATFLTYTCLVQPDLLDRHRVSSISPCVEETRYNLRDEILKQRLVKAVEVIPVKKTGLKATDYRNLSKVDLQLLETCIASKASCALITDDASLAYEAKKVKVRVFSTPSFVEHLVKNNLEPKANGTAFLLELLESYHRPNKVKAAIEKLKQI